MNKQLAFNLVPEQPGRLDDYVGLAGTRLRGLPGFVLVYGASGTGKSHLLQGLCHRALAAGDSAILLSSLSDLAPGVLEGLESSSLICLDDVDQVIGSDSWEEALFHLINAVRDRGGRLVFSSTAPVAGLEPTLADLASRLKAAYLVATDDLDDMGKLEVIRRKAHRRGFRMSEEVCRFILSRAPRDMHHLVRLVDRLDRETLMQQKRVTIPFVKAELGL